MRHLRRAHRNRSVHHRRSDGSGHGPVERAHSRHYLLDCWRWAADKEEMLKGCELKIEPIPAVTHCDGCGKDYPTVAHGKTCPHCGSTETWLAQGREVEIKEIIINTL